MSGSSSGFINRLIFSDRVVYPRDRVSDRVKTDRIRAYNLALHIFAAGEAGTGFFGLPGTSRNRYAVPAGFLRAIRKELPGTRS